VARLIEHRHDEQRQRIGVLSVFSKRLQNAGSRRVIAAGKGPDSVGGRRLSAGRNGDYQDGKDEVTTGHSHAVQVW
jgi:hypothetical protein